MRRKGTFGDSNLPISKKYIFPPSRKNMIKNDYSAGNKLCAGNFYFISSGIAGRQPTRTVMIGN